MASRRVHIVVEGRVQGVFFRAYTKEEAQKFGLTGWVRNQRDGSVEAVVKGDGAKVEQMIKWFHRGSPMSAVTRVTVTEEKPVGEHAAFEIHYY
ncbi:MAG: acylphosphatase [Thermodesulfobacteriota bacterium]|nr:acylphosphatase [Thermodesulfobacteriota bacterium]